MISHINFSSIRVKQAKNLEMKTHELVDALVNFTNPLVLSANDPENSIRQKKVPFSFTNKIASNSSSEQTFYDVCHTPVRLA